MTICATSSAALLAGSPSVVSRSAGASRIDPNERAVDKVANLDIGFRAGSDHADLKVWQVGIAATPGLSARSDIVCGGKFLFRQNKLK
jgi:hypothetical protein